MLKTVQASSGGGGSTSPGGSSGQIQYNNAGSFGGVTGTSVTGNIVGVSNLGLGYTSITAIAGTTTLTATSTYYQNVVGSTTQAIKLPDETTIPKGTAYIIDNDSTGNVTVQDSAGTTLATVTPGMAGYIYSTSNASATGGWAGYAYVPTGVTWGTSGLTMPGQLTINSGTQTTSTPALNITQTWNNASTTFDAPIFLAVTNTASASGSLLMDLQVGTTTQFSVTATAAALFTSAKLQLGLSSATPAAQTLSVGSVTAGTSNTAGANFTINGSQGTGTGAGGSIIFQTAPAGSSGTTQNALATVLTLDSTKTATFTGAISTSGNMSVSGSITTFSVISLANTVTLYGSTNGFRIANYAGSITSWFCPPANNTFQFGQYDAASPTAQTIGVQNVLASTSNTAGANWTINGSIGTGTGAGGDLIFQVAPAGSSGTTQNALAQAFRIYNNKTVLVGSGFTVAGLPAAGTAGRRAYVTDLNTATPTFLATITGGGSNVCPVFDNGTAWVAA